MAAKLAQGVKNMSGSSGLKIVEAQPKHASFVAWVILTAFRSHLERGFWDFVRPGTDEEILGYLEALTTTKAVHWVQLPRFVVAEVDGEPAAALSGYFDEKHGGMKLGDGMSEVSETTGQGPDPEGMNRALTIMNVAPEHVPEAWIIESVATRPEFRRRGLVEALMQEIMERGRQQGATVSDIGVFIGNDSAQRDHRHQAEFVVPAEAGTQAGRGQTVASAWMPAFAGMTILRRSVTASAMRLSTEACRPGSPCPVSSAMPPDGTVLQHRG
jgi:translation initiation factor 4G